MERLREGVSAAAGQLTRDPAYRPAQDSYTPVYKVGLGRPLNMGDRVLAPGTPVPYAENWPRVEAWERARRLARI